jgi:hypothetical protein
MKRVSHAALLILSYSFFACNPAVAQQSNPELQKLDDALPGVLVNDPSRLDWAFFGAGQKQEVVQDPALPGGAAIKFTIEKKGAAPHDSGASMPFTAAIKNGEDVTVLFYARTVSAETPNGKGKVRVRFQENAAPYPGFGDTDLTIDNEWKTYEVTAKANRNIPKSLAVLGFNLAGEKQVIEIGQTIVVTGSNSILKSAAIAQAPSTPGLVQLPASLKGKGVLFNNPSDRKWNFFGAQKGGAMAAITVPNLPDSENATRFTISAAGAQPYDVGVNVPLTQDIKAGDIFTVAFLVRAPMEPAGTLGKLGVRIQKDEAPYTGFGDKMLDIAPGWKRMIVRMKADADIEKGKAVLSFQLAGAKQILEIGSVFVLLEYPEPVSK